MITLSVALLILAGALAAVDLVQSQGRALTSWAVLIVCIVLVVL